MDSLFPKKPIFLDLPDAEIIYYPRFFEKEKADIIYSELEKTVSWQQDSIRIFGKTHAQPRLTALYGNEEKSYSYSNITMLPLPWTPLLQKIKLDVERVSNTNFSTVLLNYYRNGKDSNGWHADNEKELGNNPIIASLSFGAERLFQLKHNSEKSLKKYSSATWEFVAHERNNTTFLETPNSQNYKIYKSKNKSYISNN